MLCRPEFFSRIAQPQNKDPAQKHRVVQRRSCNAGYLRTRFGIKPLTAASAYRRKNHGRMHANHAGSHHQAQNQSFTEICKHFCSLKYT